MTATTTATIATTTIAETIATTTTIATANYADSVQKNQFAYANCCLTRLDLRFFGSLRFGFAFGVLINCHEIFEAGGEEEEEA